MLCDHKDAPRHVFGDILERLPRQTRLRLEGFGTRLRAKLARRIVRHGGGDSTEGRRFKRRMVEELGARYLTTLRTSLSAVDFASASACQCAIHGTLCSTDARPSSVAHSDGGGGAAAPPAPSDGGGGGVAPPPPSLWVEVAGTTCVAWSSMGAGLGWLDRSALPCLVWMFWVRFQQPDIVLHECVTRFQEEVLVRLLGDLYDVEAVVTSPSKLGIPSMRRRKYTMCIRKFRSGTDPNNQTKGSTSTRSDAAGGVAPAGSPRVFRFDEGLYGSLVGRTLRVSGDVYMVAREDRVVRYIEGVRRRRHYCLSGDADLDTSAVLPPPCNAATSWNTGGVWAMVQRASTGPCLSTSCSHQGTWGNLASTRGTWSPAS